ncbi:MAG: hypothetical protein DWH81_08950 [Planctomycetota bacterium]|jgi:hypothetical protein|nr:MAG: hypothetical protein DWH81_08950 [Planctomycetota bacterium]
MDDRLSGSGISRRQFQSLLALCVPAALTGCGTLLYPERRGQGRGGRVDWTVAGMDAIGLVLFFIPGVIAFGVDYYNGTLFYPESEGRAAAGRLKRVPLPGSHPSKEQIAQAISAASGKQITLQDGTFVTQSLNTLDDFWSTHQQLLARVEQGDLVIRCQSPSL